MADPTGLPASLLPPAFWLVPLNRNAKRATTDPKNHLWSVALADGNWGFYLSFDDETKQEITLGRGNTDIYLPEPRGGADISKHHCSFVNNTKRGAVLLVDHSSKNNTEPYSSNQGGVAIPFQNDKRSVLVAHGINGFVAFGKNKYYEFQIQWQSDGLYDFPNKDEPYGLGRRKKYLKGSTVGGGSYGSVWWALDVTSGELMAVKSFHHLDGKNLEFAKREVDNLVKINRSRIPHSHIIEILDYSGGTVQDNFLEIMMPLMEGNLKKLVEDHPDRDFSRIVLRQMLLALKCLAEHKVVHRDVKPENILYEFRNDDYHFRLGDFGLSNDQTLARTIAGTEPFMAPEVLNRKKQSEKVDIWSLFATIVWMRDIDNFRRSCTMRQVAEIHQWLVRLAAKDSLSDVRSMASLKPKHRPTAKELLRALPGLPTSSYDPVDELADSFETGLAMQDDVDGGCVAGPSGLPGGYDTGDDDDDDDDGNEGRDTFPPMPYYEPYSPYLGLDEHGGPAGYNPPPPGFEPRGRGRNWGNEYANAEEFNTPRPGIYQGGGGAWGDFGDARTPGLHARAPGMNEDAWVATIEPPYGRLDGSAEGTEVPDIRTARQLPTQDLPVQSTTNTDRKGKGKKRK